MNILVCVKQVPDTSEIKIDPVTNTLIRKGVPSIVNPFDSYALEAAAQIKDKVPDTKIVALSMGIEQAKNALKDCLAIAADQAYLVSDRLFGGSDTLATSYILSNAVKKIEELEGTFDVIFCGKQAIDGDTAQVGPELAEHLGYAQVTCALDAEVDGSRLKVLKEDEDRNILLGVQMPCVVTFSKSSKELRFPTVKRRIAANHWEIKTITAADLAEIDLTRVGLKGSPTKVKSTFVPERKSGGIFIKEDTVEASARKLCALLANTHMI